jgi:ABC-type bacteriocin/lantibiotic exporter with double-glycine peptidase domain
MLNAAPILILDEATSHLDALTEERLMQSLEPFMAGRTTLIISHRRAGFRHVDQLIELNA